MRTKTIPLDLLEAAGRWRVELFLDEETPNHTSSVPLVELATLCEERTDMTDPMQSGSAPFVYIGLENVESITGDLLGDTIRKPGDIKSRCKQFSAGDVLYGRLRPGLRKVAVGPSAGLCSTEFIVLRPKDNVLSAQVLRALLASKVVSKQLERLQTGAALPRVAARDLMAVKVPAPGREKQKKLERILEELGEQRRTAKAILRDDVSKFEDAVMNAVTGRVSQDEHPRFP